MARDYGSNVRDVQAYPSTDPVAEPEPQVNGPISPEIEQTNGYPKDQQEDLKKADAETVRCTGLPGHPCGWTGQKEHLIDGTKCPNCGKVNA